MELPFKIIGVGGAGCNILDFLWSKKLDGVELITINTDAQDLKKKKADLKLQIGRKLTSGLGAGMNPDIGKRALLEEKDLVLNSIKPASLYILVIGLGGGTGSGAGPELAKALKERGGTVFGIFVLPFYFEGRSRLQIAQNALLELKKSVDSYLLLDNNKLFDLAGHELSVLESFKTVEGLVYQITKTIVASFQEPQIVKVNFADIIRVLEKGGQAFFGTGQASGENRAREAMNKALSSPLLKADLKNAKAVLFTVLGKEDVSLMDLQEASQVLKKETGADTKIIFGAGNEKTLGRGKIQINILITGF